MGTTALHSQDLRRVRRLAIVLSLGLIGATLGLLAPPVAVAEQASSQKDAYAAARLAAGELHTCAIVDSGSVRCWGLNHVGQLGYGDAEYIGDDETPASAGSVSLGGAAVAIAAGRDHTCALMTTGAVRCWGGGNWGQLGYANTVHIGDDETPASAGDVPLGGTATAITAGQVHTCALMTSGAVRCWGSGNDGRLGYANTEHIGDDETPASAGDVPLGGTATAIAAGTHHTCALLTTDAVRCWGYGDSGRLGYGNTDNIGDNESPASAGDIALGGPAVVVSAGSRHTCAVLGSGATRCWGDGDSGKLGYGSTQDIGDDESPASAGSVSLGGRADSIAAGYNHTCAVLLNGKARCWGYGSGGALGYANTDHVGDDETPASVGVIDLVEDAAAITVGEYHSCAVLSNGRVRCWGSALYGQLGYGNTDTIGDDETPAAAGYVDIGGLIPFAPPPAPTPAASKVKLKAKPKRDRTAPYVYRTTTKVTNIPAEACTGKVTLKLKAKPGGKTVSLLGKKPRLKLKDGTCTAAKALKVKPKKFTAKSKTKLILIAKFPGNALAKKAKQKKVLYAG